MSAVVALVLGMGLLFCGACKPGIGPENEQGASSEASINTDSNDSNELNDLKSGSVDVDAIASLVGRWRSDESAQAKRQRLEAIDEVTTDLSVFVRGRARSSLAERTAPSSTLLISVIGRRVKIVSSDRQIELDLSGAPTEVSGSQVRATVEGERLIITAQGDNGERTTEYRCEGTNLAMAVTINSDKLAGPLNCVTTYTRED